MTPFFTRLSKAFVPSRLSQVPSAAAGPPLEKCIISGRCVCKFPRSRSRSKPPSPRRIPRPPTRARVRSVLFRGKLGGGGGATDLSGENCCGGALEFWKRRSSFTRRAAQNFFKAQFPHHTIRTCSFLPLLMRVHLLVAKRRPHFRFGPCLKRCTLKSVAETGKK